jgi:hypothetical protein
MLSEELDNTISVNPPTVNRKINPNVQVWLFKYPLVSLLPVKEAMNKMVGS